MRIFKRLIIGLLLLMVLGVVAVKWGLRTQRGQDWLTRRLSVELAMDVRLLDADLCWPGVLHIRGLQLELGDGGRGGSLEVRETRIGWWRRPVLELRRPHLRMRRVNGQWEPAALAPLAQVAAGVVTALDPFSRVFRDRWDLEVRDGRVFGAAESGDPILYLNGLRWSSRRVSLPGRAAWHQRAEAFAWAGAETERVHPAVWEWLSLDSGAILLSASLREGRAEPAGTVENPEVALPAGDAVEESL